MMWRKRRLALVVLTLALICTGCLETKILEEMGLSVIVGYDPDEDGKITGTSLLHQIDPGAKENVIVVGTTSDTSKGIRNKQNREMSKRVVSGQLRVAVYNEKIARNGIMPLVDTLKRDPSISNTMYLIVSRGKAESIIAHDYPEIVNIGSYLYKMIRQNIRGEQIVSCTLHEFLQAYYSEGLDPVLPIARQVGDEIHLESTAIFLDDKMVGELNMEETFLLKMMKGRYRAGSLELVLDAEPLKEVVKNLKDSELKLVVENIHSKTNIKLVTPSPPTYRIDIKLEGRIQEISSELNLGQQEILRVIEQGISDRLATRTKMMIDKAKKLKADPIGLGEVYRSTIRGSKLTRERWREIYPDVKVDISIKTKIIRSGVSD
ncbi:Ger(x)C family spore germination protein [Paenibacillus silviterrae]|uniref:Ger(x)C family spore germination protein n=1 Tax=Paenibacillus silviterrae TaxID=3242194 RepID=UPI002543128A|nr:Ger(x)C family spore germination protein [Paenibacillus chinjuensis]